jgi:hypothetical protein
VDTKLPGDIRFSLEGIYGRDFNPAVITDENMVFNESRQISPNDTRRFYKKLNSGTAAYLITNAGNKAYYFSLSTSLGKTFDFGLDLNASYTYSIAKSYGDGIGDQVSAAYKTNRFSINGMNDLETGYANYVSPHRVLISALYRKEYAKNFASSVGLVYEGMNMGYYAGSYSGTRYSYVMTSAISGDGGSNSLIYIPGSREELNNWNFADYKNGETVTYSADEQRNDFWNYIEQDDYLKNHKGEYAERGGAVMPWHHQLDFKFNQDFFIKVGKTRNTLQFGVDIKNLLNLLNSNWGLYKQVNNVQLLSYNSQTGAYQFQQNNKERLTSTYSDYRSPASCYSIQFSIRYIFN